MNHQKVSKYYEHDCLRNFLSFFISLLTAVIVKNCHILATAVAAKNRHVLARIYFIFLKKSILNQTIHKIFERNSSFHVKYRITGKVQ